MGLLLGGDMSNTAGLALNWTNLILVALAFLAIVGTQ
jgi:hypothetical protein